MKTKTEVVASVTTTCKTADKNPPEKGQSRPPNATVKPPLRHSPVDRHAGRVGFPRRGETNNPGNLLRLPGLGNTRLSGLGRPPEGDSCRTPGVETLVCYPQPRNTVSPNRGVRAACLPTSMVSSTRRKSMSIMRLSARGRFATDGTTGELTSRYGCSTPHPGTARRQLQARGISGTRPPRGVGG
jgi:hypothetical protein